MSTHHATRLALLMAITMATSAVSALQPGTFTQYPLQPTAGAAGIQMTRLAVLDASPQIPVMVVHSAATEVQSLLTEYQGSGLLLGAAPEPPELLDAMLQRMGVDFYPAVIEDGVVWQVRDDSVQRPPRPQPETITVPAAEKPQPVLTEGPDTEPSAEALALQRELDAMRQQPGTGNTAGTVLATEAGNAAGNVPVTGGGVPPSSAADVQGATGSNGAVIKPQSGNPATLPESVPAASAVQ